MVGVFDVRTDISTSQPAFYNPPKIERNLLNQNCISDLNLQVGRLTEGFYDADSQRSEKRQSPNIVPTERTLPKIVGVRGLATEGTRPKRLTLPTERFSNDDSRDLA